MLAGQALDAVAAVEVEGRHLLAALAGQGGDDVGLASVEVVVLGAVEVGLVLADVVGLAALAGQLAVGLAFLDAVGRGGGAVELGAEHEDAPEVVVLAELDAVGLETGIASTWWTRSTPWASPACSRDVQAIEVVVLVLAFLAVASGLAATWWPAERSVDGLFTSLACVIASHRSALKQSPTIAGCGHVLPQILDAIPLSRKRPRPAVRPL